MAAEISSHSSSTLAPPSFEERNTYAILDKAKEMFIQAINEVNAKVSESGVFSLCYDNTEHPKKRIFQVPIGTEFKDLSFQVSLVKGIEISFRPSEGSYYEKEGLFLGKINPFFSGTNPVFDGVEPLLEMVQTGNIAPIDNIHPHWFKEFNDEIAFCVANEKQIAITKDKINEAFYRAINWIRDYSRVNYQKNVFVDPENVTSEKVSQPKVFEPLMRHVVGEAEPGKSWIIIGHLTLIKSREEFKRYVTSAKAEDFEDLYKRCRKRMKTMVDIANQHVLISIGKIFCSVM